MNYEKLWSRPLFESGRNGYASFRIPALLSLPNGTILAFAEGRKNSRQDWGEIDIVERISTDGGLNFGELRVAVSGFSNTAGNPCPVYDRFTGRIVMLFNRNLADGPESMILRGEAPRTVHMVVSDDHGESWSGERDLTPDVKLPEWTWYACGPCHAVQLDSGRLVIPCNHAVLGSQFEENDGYISHALYSDDHGRTWKISADVGPMTNESTLACLGGNKLLINMRSYHGQGCRALALSENGGESWLDFRLEPMLPEPRCQGTMLDIRHDGRTQLLFCNPADPHERKNLTIHESLDGLQWHYGCTVTTAPSAYSDLCLNSNGELAILYETGESNPYERIDFGLWKLY